MAMVDDIPFPKCTLYSYMDVLIIIELVRKKTLILKPQFPFGRGFIIL